MKAAVGDVVLSCLPYVHVLMGKERGGRCDECFREGSLREQTLNRCSKCRIAHYCSPKCQRAAWTLHKIECEGFLRTKPDVPTESVRLLARIVIKYERKDHLVKEKFKGLPGSRCFDDLMSHVEDILSDPVKSQQFVTAWETLRMFLSPSYVDGLFPGDPRSAADALAVARPPEKSDLDADSDAPLPASSILVGAAIFGRISVNSFSILDDEVNPIGVGVYLPASKLDHACEGNVSPFFDGIRLNLRARANIENVTFANVSLCYVDPLSPTWERKENLLSQYYFNCGCSWCRPSADAQNVEESNEGKSGSPRVMSTDSRLDSFPLTPRDARMLSVKCGCAEKRCPKTRRSCPGVVELTFDERNAAPPSTLPTSTKLNLSGRYALDTKGASFSECDLCFCRLESEARKDSIETFVDVVGSSNDALKAIEEVRKEEAHILRSNDEEERKRHFEMVLTLCKNLLQRQAMLHPFNIFMLRALDQAFDVCVHLGNWKEALFFGQKTLAPFRYYHPNPHPTVALQLFKIAKLLAYLEPPTPSVIGLLTDAVEMLRLTHGPSGDASGRVTSDASELLTQLRDEMRAQEGLQGLAIENGEELV